MDRLPTEILHHIVSFGILGLLDYKNIRICGSHRLEEVFRIAIFQNHTVKWMNLASLGLLMDVKGEDISFMSSASHDHSTTMPELLHKVALGRISRLIRRLIIIIPPTVHLYSAKCAVDVNPDQLQRSKIQEPESGSFAHRVLLVALSGGLPNLSTVVVECAEASETTIFADDCWMSDVSRLGRWTGWAVMRDAVDNRAKAIHAAQNIPATTTLHILPIEEFYLKNIHFLSALQMFRPCTDHFAPHSPSPRIRINDWDRRISFPLEYLTIFSADFHPTSVNDPLYQMSLFRPWKAVIQEDDGNDSPVPTMIPWTMQVRAMKNLKHLHLGVNTALDSNSSAMYTIDPLIREYRQPYDGKLQDFSEKSQLANLQVQEMMQFQRLFTTSRTAANSLHHRFMYDMKSDIDAEEQYVDFGDCADVSWPKLETFSLFNFRVAVATLRHFLDNHKTIRNLALERVLFCQVQEKEMEKAIKNFTGAANNDVDDAVPIGKGWSDEIEKWEMYNTWLSQVAHFTTLSHLSAVCIVNCMAKSGYGRESLDEPHLAVLTQKLLSLGVNDRMLQFASNMAQQSIQNTAHADKTESKERVAFKEVQSLADVLQKKNISELKAVLKIFSCRSQR